MIFNSPDALDQAAEITDREREYLLEAHKQRAMETALSPKGFCYNCGDSLPADRTFCDADCAEDYEYILKRKEANR